MKFILDTHALIWFFSGHSNLSNTVREQAIAENIPIMSRDGVFDAYPVKRIWD
jgi:PIN domain nuclease of toxin-antitoxin system